MNNQMRLNITLRVWLAAFIIGLIYGQSGLPIFAYTIATATVATIFIWGGLAIEPILKIFNTSATLPTQQSSSNTSDKAYKLAVLLEMMDEDEREDFKHRLKNDLIGNGDDSISLESLITEKQKRG